ncbi:MAG: tRNA 2-thiouridine(34) synthase MnmA [Candidatus Omnitrophota bacterium]|nr:tRNA 2-thiouridine(34) synthase MnmA [Candidatus Omnitrophota bacterium]
MTFPKRSFRKKRRRIAVAMSGGVDSSLAAALLLKEGYEVIGVTFRMWPKEECGASLGRACCNLEAVTRARAVAGDLGIPYYVFDFSEEFKAKVIDYFCDEYLKGYTPNPCVICNEKIKFGLLHEKAMALDASLIATGHYADKGFNRRTGRFFLRQGVDLEKDQTYFLFSLSQEQLRYSAFPLSGYTKGKVRTAAKRFKIVTHNTASSQDICFIRDLDYAEYIKKKTGIMIKKGDIVNKEGKILGVHKGIPYYTIGQRRGLGIAYSEPLYVTGIDMVRNRVIVGVKRDILKNSIFVHRLNWMSINGIDRDLRVKAKIRYNHEAEAATVSPVGPDMVRVDFDLPQEAPTPGQAVVFYNKGIVVGGGWIKEVV